MQVESQIINAAETLFFGKLYNYKISLTCGIEKKDSNASNKGGSIVISLFKNGEEYIFDQSEFSDLLKNIGALIDFECFKIMQKRAVEETPLLSKANIILNREQREEAAQLNYDAVFSLYRKDSSVKTVKEEEE